MVRRSAATLVVLALPMLAAASGGSSQERPLAPAELQQKAFQRGTVRILVKLAAAATSLRVFVSPSSSAPGGGHGARPPGGPLARGWGERDRHGLAPPARVALIATMGESLLLMTTLEPPTPSPLLRSRLPPDPSGGLAGGRERSPPLTRRCHRDRIARRGWWRPLVGAVVLVLAMTSCAGSSQAPGVAPDLSAKARAQGLVLVVVTLRAPEGASPSAIAALKKAVLAEIASTRHRVVRELTGLPQIALEASTDTLQALGASANVARIDESIAQPPLR